ncbi:unnamed protein product, partial [Mesorhabditis belari]|uniref:Uncharacterized protein n=1 Tax=Mesorhabditis belari TaxID=2138241 RepID=A0AAF3FC94_9BILA
MIDSTESPYGTLLKKFVTDPQVIRFVVLSLLMTFAFLIGITLRYWCGHRRKGNNMTNALATINHHKISYRYYNASYQKIESEHHRSSASRAFYANNV